jgi:hypothetical protein
MAPIDDEVVHEDGQQHLAPERKPRQRREQRVGADALKPAVQEGEREKEELQRVEHVEDVFARQHLGLAANRRKQRLEGQRDERQKDDVVIEGAVRQRIRATPGQRHEDGRDRGGDHLGRRPQGSPNPPIFSYRRRGVGEDRRRQFDLSFGSEHHGGPLYQESCRQI